MVFLDHISQYDLRNAIEKLKNPDQDIIICKNALKKQGILITESPLQREFLAILPILASAGHPAHPVFFVIEIMRVKAVVIRFTNLHLYL